MPNGKPGDNVYDDIIRHGYDFGEPETAARVRALHALSIPAIEHLVVDLVELTLAHRPPNEYYRKAVGKHLDTIYRLATGQSLSS